METSPILPWGMSAGLISDLGLLPSVPSAAAARKVSSSTLVRAAAPAAPAIPRARKQRRSVLRAIWNTSRFQIEVQEFSYPRRGAAGSSITLAAMKVKLEWGFGGE